MIQKYIDRFMEKRDQLRSNFIKKHPEGYGEIVKEVVKLLSDEDADGWGDCMDPLRIHLIDDGDYQGMQLYIIGATGYQPSTYWYVPVWYGSCSGCDTYQAIREYGNEPPTEMQVKEYMDLALHVVQKLRKMETI